MEYFIHHKIQHPRFMKGILLGLLTLVITLKSVAQSLDTVVYLMKIPDTVFVKEKNKKWTKPAIAVGYTAFTFLTYKYLDVELQDESQEGKDGYETAVANVVSPFGLGKYNSIACGATALISVLTKDKKLQKTVVIWAGSLGVNSVLTDQLKTTFQRHRPNTGDPYNIFDWRGGPGINRSFPSAHTSNVFTTATVWATLYKNKKWVPPVAYGIASLTGLSRIYDNAHWASDVLVGAAVGFLSAKLMITLYNKVERKIFIRTNMNDGHKSIGIIYPL